MPGKMARSGPRPSFGLAAVPVTVGTSRLSCGKAVKREYSRRFGSHLGNPGLNSIRRFMLGDRYSCFFLGLGLCHIAWVRPGRR